MKNSLKNKLDIYLKIINIIIIFTLGFIGHSINKQLASINVDNEQRNIAKDTKQFWEDISMLLINSSKRSRELGRIISIESGSVGYIADYYNKNKGSFNKSILSNNDKLKQEYYEFMKTNSLAYELIHKTLIEYKEIRLKYSHIARSLGIKGWSDFVTLDKEMSDWALQEYKILKDDYTFVSDLEIYGKSNIDINVEEKAYITGYKFSGIDIPYYDKLLKLMSLNIQELKKKKTKF